MRFGTAVAAAAVLGLATARTPSNYAIKKVRETRHKLEKLHGKGMTGLYDLKGSFKPERLGKGMKSPSRTLGAGATATIEGIDGTFALDGWEMSLLGALQGFTYSEVQGEDNSISNCFFAGYSIIENVDDIVYIFQHAADDAGSYKWFEWLIEEPLNLLLNSTVTYQMCNFSEYLVMIKSWLDIDISAFAYDGTSMIINAITDIPPVYQEWAQLQCEGTCSCDGDTTAPEDCDETVNAYQQGLIVGKAVTKFFGTMVSPVVA